MVDGNEKFTGRLGDEAGERQFALEFRQFLSSGAVLSAAGLVQKKDPHGGIGLFATRPLLRGFELEIPTRWVLDVTSARSTRLGQGGLGFYSPLSASARNDIRKLAVTEEEVLLLVLADARPTRQSGSPWAPYAEILPQTAPDVGSWPAGVAQDLLRGTDLGAALLEAEKDLAALHAKVVSVWGVLSTELLSANDDVKPPAVSLDDLRWARGMLLSRRFPDLVGRGGGASPGIWGDAGSMVPLLDFLNHGPHIMGVKTRGFEDECWDGTVGGCAKGNEIGVVSVGNSAPCAKGTEVLHNYGARKSNEELMAMYGFALARNPSDRVSLLIPCKGGGEPVRCHVDRTGITEEIFEALLSVTVMGSGEGGGGSAEQEEEGGGDEDEAELAAVTALGEAIAEKLSLLSEHEPAEETYARATTLGISAGQVASVRHYRQGLAEVMATTLRECEAMAQVAMTSEDVIVGGTGEALLGMENEDMVLA